MKTITITGTPGTGKSTVSEEAANRIEGAVLIHVNDIIKERKLYTSRSRKDGALIVDMKRLKLELERLIRRARCRVLIFEGHLLCDVRLKRTTAIVMREHLPVLLARMRKRGYSIEKIKSNLVSEATDYCGIRALENYGKVYELIGKDAAASVAKIASGKHIKLQRIELLDELLPTLQDRSLRA